MAKRASSGHRISKFSRREEVRVIHIGNPRIVKASPSEFSTVVQSLTGLKKRKSSPSNSKEVEWESSKSKEPRHEDEFQFCSNLGIPETAVLPHKAHENNNKYSCVDQLEICDMFSSQMMSTVMDCFDGKILPDIFSFDFMNSTSDVV